MARRLLCNPRVEALATASKATNPDQMRWQMEALILIAIFLSFADGSGGKAGW
jgi:hypothetical protein